MKPPQEGRNTGTPSLRGLQGHFATGLNGQAAKEEVSALWQGGWMPENISGVPAGRSVFHLTSPFIGLSVKGQNALWERFRQRGKPSPAERSPSGREHRGARDDPGPGARLSETRLQHHDAGKQFPYGWNHHQVKGEAGPWLVWPRRSRRQPDRRREEPGRGQLSSFGRAHAERRYGNEHGQPLPDAQLLCESAHTLAINASVKGKARADQEEAPSGPGWILES
jgi:hypothetical protein